MHRLFLIVTLCFARAGFTASLGIFPPDIHNGPKTDQQRVIVSYTDDAELALTPTTPCYLYL